MLNRTYENQVCSIARALEIVGERWTILIVRDAFLGVRRFDDFQRSLGIARNVLADRPDRLVGAGIFERRRYQDRPPRYEYRLTERGHDLHPVIFSLMKWGDKHAAPNGPPRPPRPPPPPGGGGGDRPPPGGLEGGRGGAGPQIGARPGAGPRNGGGL